MIKPILIVDSNSFICGILKNILGHKLGLPVMAVTDIQEGAGFYAEKEISFILLGADWQGAELKQAVDYLKSMRPDNTVVVIIMVSDKEERPEDLLSVSGANGYIFKPFTEGEITDWIKSNAESLLGIPWNSVSSQMQSAVHNSARSESEAQRIEDLMISLSSLDFATKAKAIVELGRLRVTESTEPLVKLLFSDDDDLKVHVIVALGNIGDKGPVPDLVSFLNYSDQKIKEAAVEALAKIGDPRTVRPLSRMLKVNDKKLVLLALKALGMLGSHEAVPILEEMLEVSDAEVRANAQWAIRKIDGMDV